MCAYYKRVFLIFLIVCVGHLNSQDGYEPFAVVVHSENIDIALPEPQSRLRFHLGENEKLVCFCPKNVNDNTLAPLPQAANSQFCENSCSNDLIPVIESDSDVDCADDADFIATGYQVNLGFSVKVSNIFIIKSITKGINHWFKNLQVMEIVYFCWSQVGVKFAMNEIRAPYHFTFDKKTSELETRQYSNERYHQNDPSGCYEEENQRKSFRDLFKNDFENYFKWGQISSKDHSTFRFFVKQQLVESDDMVMESWKNATYYNFNTIPVWITVKEGSLRRANDFVRVISYKLNTATLSLTGIYDQLAIENHKIQLFDSKNKTNIPVPLLLWKFLYFHEHNAGLFIIIFNDINSQPPKEDDFCTWTSCPVLKERDVLENLSTATEGFMFCCKFERSLLDKLNVKLDQELLSDVRTLNSETIDSDGYLKLPPIDTHNTTEDTYVTSEDDNEHETMNMMTMNMMTK